MKTKETFLGHDLSGIYEYWEVAGKTIRRKSKKVSTFEWLNK